MRVSTLDVEKRVNDEYDKLRITAKKNDIDVELNICFCKTPPLNYQGKYAYSDEEGYHYCEIEREKTNHRVTKDIFEFFYWIYSNRTLWMAIEYEYKNRVAQKDSRRLIFKKQLELLELIDDRYRNKCELEIEKILNEYPYNDI